MVESRSVTGLGASFARLAAPARSARRSRSAMVALLLAGAAMNATGARAATALDLSGLSVPLANLDTASVNYDFVQNGIALLSSSSNYSFGGILRDGTGVQVFSLHKAGVNTLTLTGANTYSGDTVVNAGILQAGAAHTLSANSKMIVNAMLDLAGGDQTVAGLSGNGDNINSGVAAVLMIDLASGLETYGGPISGAGAAIKIVKSGAGQQNLHGHSSYTGGTDIAGGTLGFGAADSLGTGKITFTGAGGTLVANGTNTVLANAIQLNFDANIDGGGHAPTLTGLITGTGLLTKTDGGTLQIDNVFNDYGGTVVTQGTLLLGNSNVLGFGALTITGNSRVNAISSQSLDNAVVLQGGNMTVDSPGTTLELDGIVSGTGGINVSDGATLILGSANTYSGATQLDGSTLGIRDGLAIGGGANPILAFNSALASYGVNLTVANTIRVHGDFTVDTNGYVLTLSGPINDVNGANQGALNVIGGGRLVLTAASNNYTLGTTVSNSVLEVSSNAQLGNGNAGIALNSGELRIDGTGFTATTRVLTLTGLLNRINVVDAGATVALGLVTGGGNLVKDGLGAISLTGTNFQGETSAGSGVINFDTNGAFGTGSILVQGGNIVTATNGLTLANTIALTGGGGEIHADGNDLTLNGLIYSVGKLVKSGSGAFNINNVNTYSGGTHITDGTVRVGASGALGSGTIEMEDFARLTTSVDATLTNAIVINSHVHIDGGGTHTLNLTGDISGTGNIHMWSEAGTVALSGNNTYSGGTDVEFGTLRVDSSTGTGNTRVEAAARLQGVGSLADATVHSGGTLAPGNSAGTISFANLTLDSGSLLDFELAAPGTTGSGVNDFIIVNGNLSLGATFNFTDLGGFGAGTYHLINYTGILSGTGPVLGTVPSGFGSFTFVTGGGFVDLVVTTLASSIQYWDGGNVVGNNVINGGTGTWNTAGQNWTNSAGSTNTGWGSDTAIFAGVVPGVVTVAGTQNFNKLEFDLTGYTLTGGTLHAGGAGEVDVAASVTATINSAISGSVGLIKTGDGTLSLGGTNSMTGGVHVAAGTLEVASTGALGFGTFNIDAGTVIKLDSGFANNTVVNGVGGAGATFDTTPFNITLSGDIVGTGTITKTGAAALALSGDNSGFSGGINLTEGRLSLLSSNAAGTGPITTTGSTISYANGIASVAPIIVNSNTTQLFVLAGDKATQAGAISELNGPRAIFKIGGGNLVLTGANTISGPVILNDGTLTVAGGNNLGSGTLDANANVRLDVGLVGGQAITIANDIRLNGQLTVGLIGTSGPTFNSATGLVESDGNNVTLAGRITGAGGLITDGSTPGNLIILGTDADGPNTYSGGTVLTNAVASVGANDALGTGLVTLGAGSGIVNNSGGALTVGNAVNVSAGNTSLGGGRDLALTGAITGAGNTIYKLGDGVLTLANSGNGVNADLQVRNGTLRVDGALTNAVSSVLVFDGATLQGTGSIAGDVTLQDNAILAPGDSPGTLTVGSLFLNNSTLVNYELGEANVLSSVWNDRTVVTGALTLDGLLNVSDSHTFGLGVYNLFTYGGALTDNGLDVVTLPGGYSGTIETLVSGQVNLIVTAPGDLIQYWDGTDMTGEVPGTVLGGSGVWNNLNTNWTSDPFQLNASWQNAVAIFAGASAGTVELQENENFSQLQFQLDGYHVTATGAGGLTVTAGDIIQTATGVTATIDATIGGTGSITKQGLGNLVLNAANTYSGNTLLTAGTLTVGDNAALGTGVLVMADQTILTTNTTGPGLANDVITLGGARIDSGPGTLQLDGIISGGGSISQIGTGDLILNGHNTFTGNLGINKGTVTLGNSAAASTGLITIDDQAILASGADNIVLGNQVDLTGAARIDTKAFTMTVNGVITGPGSLSQVGTGNLVLNGHNTFTGNLDINKGTVTLGNSDAASTGLITIDDQAILAASADLVVGNHVNLNAGAARIDTKASTVVLNGQVTGPGSLSMIGTGNLILNGHNTFTGNLGINKGTVTLGNSAAASTGLITIDDQAILASGADNIVLGNQVDLTGAARIDTKAFTMTVNGVITGPGSLSQVGTGNLILNCANTFAAGLGINQGTVTLGTNTAAGTGYLTINDGATLKSGVTGLVVANNIQTTGAGRIDSGTGAFTLTGEIGNVGGITKVGTGVLTLTNSSGFTGGTTVAAGRLDVNGALTASVVTVGAGGTLGGTGTIVGLVVQAGGTVAPGLSPGTFTVAGNATFTAGSTYAAEISGAVSDKLVVTGTAALNGANIALVAGATPAIFGTTYQILTAAGGRTGAFTPTTTGFIQAFKPTLVYSATDVKLTLAPASIVGLLGSGAGGSSNITNIAAAFDTSVTAGFNPQSFFNIFLQSGGALGASLNQLTGEVTSANSRTAMADTRYVREAALDRLGASLGGTGGATNGVNTTGTDEHNVSVWARGIGSWTKSSSDGNGSHLSIDAKGVITGVDASFGDWKVGGLFNYLESDVDTRGLGKGKVKSTGGGVYAGYRADKGIAFGIGGAASHVRSTENRTVSFPGTSQALTGKTGGTSYQVFGDVSYDLAAAANTRVEPFFRAAYVKYNLDGFSEAGGFTGLNIAKDKYDTTYLTAGLRGSILLGSSAWLRGSAGYQRTTGDRSPVSLVTIQGTSTAAAIRGVALDTSAFAGELGVDATVAKNVTLGAGYSGVLGKNTKDNGVKATLTVGF
ncbi:autotransporter-associated beta strand repeat-containing protein [Sphingosinicellaceae bacterium]|nr:autotransporter-associated beta strand repeat-containing protein [Sphingosinicellaceae bacterium]